MIVFLFNCKLTSTKIINVNFYYFKNNLFFAFFNKHNNIKMSQKIIKVFAVFPVNKKLFLTPDKLNTTLLYWLFHNSF